MCGCGARARGRLAGAGVARGGRRGQRAAGRRGLVLHARLRRVQVEPPVLDALVDFLCRLEESLLHILAPGIRDDDVLIIFTTIVTNDHAKSFENRIISCKKKKNCTPHTRYTELA